MTSGIEVVDEIANVPTDYRDKPLTPVVMKKVRGIEVNQSMPIGVKKTSGKREVLLHRRSEIRAIISNSRQKVRVPVSVLNMQGSAEISIIRNLH